MGIHVFVRGLTRKRKLQQETRLPEGQSYLGGTRLRDRPCTHASERAQLTLVEWCVRCSGWRYGRADVEQQLSHTLWWPAVWDERAFLPSEEFGPDEAMAIATRIFRAAMELEQDSHNI